VVDSQEDKFDKEFLSIRDALEYIQGLGLGTLHESTIRGWCKDLNIGFKVGGSWRVRKSALDAYLKIK